jgi:hypothetical protein
VIAESLSGVLRNEMQSESHPPITTSASMVSDTSTNMVSKEANFILPSASLPHPQLYAIR